MSESVLDPVTVAMVSLAANIAANHPQKGLCQLERLRGYGVDQAKIELVVDIARHLRDEAGQMLDHAFDAAAAIEPPSRSPASLETVAGEEGCCCSTTAKGNVCC